MKAASLLLPIVIAVGLFAQSPRDSSGPIPFEDHGKWGYISANGIVIPPRFDLAAPFSGEGAIACVADQCGVLGQNGSFVSPTWNRQSRPFPENYSEGLALANTTVNGVTSTVQETLSSRSNSDMRDSSIRAWHGSV
jgi:hypothetical protein